MSYSFIKDKGDALLSLVGPNFVLDDETVTYNEGVTPPTEAEINAEIIRLQAEYDALAYSRTRATAFPSIGDQLDMQYHDLLDGTTTWKDAVAKVKSDNPKE